MVRRGLAASRGDAVGEPSVIIAIGTPGPGPTAKVTIFVPVPETGLESETEIVVTFVCLGNNVGGNVGPDADLAIVVPVQ